MKNLIRLKTLCSCNKKNSLLRYSQAITRANTSREEEQKQQSRTTKKSQKQKRRPRKEVKKKKGLCFGPSEKDRKRGDKKPEFLMWQLWQTRLFGNVQVV